MGSYLFSEMVSFPSFVKRFDESGFYTESEGMFLIVREEKVIGMICFKKDESLGSLSLTFFNFSLEDRKKGYVKEAISLLSKYLFATQKVQRLQILVPDYFKVASHIAQSAGYQFEGIARSAYFHRGKYLDLCIYSLLRSECKEIEKIYHPF